MADAAQHALHSEGQPLDKATRAGMEPKFGHDFSQVRVHAGQQAGEAARALNARAYTVGPDIVFGANEYQPSTARGRQLIAHELAHTVQQGGKGRQHPDASAKPSAAAETEADAAGNSVARGGNVRLRQSVAGGALQRTPEAPEPFGGGDAALFDRSVIDVPAIPDISIPAIKPQTITAKITHPQINHLAWYLYDPTDNLIAGFDTMPGRANSLKEPFVMDRTQFPKTVTEGRYILRCIGRVGGKPVAYADRTFYVWATASATARTPPDIAALRNKKKTLDADTASGSGKSFGQVGASFTQKADVEQDLDILTKGTGHYVGSKSKVKPAGTTVTDCTLIVLEILEKTFNQQGKSADWAKVKAKYEANQLARPGQTGLSGLDVQSALQSEAGWKGIYWAPDPTYLVPDAELEGAKSDEASFTNTRVKQGRPYLKKKGQPGVTIDHSVTNYAPEAPKDTATYQTSTTTKDTTQLDKLKKLPFGVLSAHGGYHMTLITYGKVLEVHWHAGAEDVDLIEETDLESWAVGPNSGFHYYASGAIVAPAADVDAAFATP